MSSGITDAISGLTKRVADALEQLITVRVQFEELRRYTRETIDEYKRLPERANDRIERVERERVAKEAELSAKIEGLSARLDALSEGALHAAIQRMAPEVLASHLRRNPAAGVSTLPQSLLGDQGPSTE
jgi:hypothetical protein